MQEHLENKTYYVQSAEWKIIQHVTRPRQMKVTNSSIECSQANRLIIIGEMHNMYHNDCANRNQSFIDRMKSSSTMVHITYLKVCFEEIFADAFIEFLHLFPDLDSLKISCRSLQPLNRLSGEDSEIIRSLKNNNKITKLSLWWMIRGDHACFLIDLFPLIEYLEVDCTNFINLNLFLRHVSSINTNLSSMSLFFDRIDDRLVNIIYKRKLENTKKKENLVLNMDNVRQIDENALLERS